ncbi:MAG: hypothetical protein COS99_00460 [Candidatus Omnitrophica bacterium CG07_land_8_20_14_0_80_42_15]|uniref:Lipoyl-binding domain-containing protein n=1 Tax=Candidatus Aquitaenariimonas noxiae TaxID=1974741 RepID=A0A2J0L4Y6_9BACT|nr:MAG: hypothetical protein COS99_00460 [Candidatus Omnitrophica bacterium CG07_land_8_20_14_0_80_42_15]
MLEVKLPELAEGVNSATLTFWHFEEGDHVEEGEDLVEMATDKATFNVPVPSAGVVNKKFFHEGDTVNVGDVIANIKLES